MALARYDRARSRSVLLIDERRLDAVDERAVATLVTMLRATGRDPGEGYWTHHRTRYPTEIETTGA